MSLNITLYQSKEISPISDILIYPRVNHSTTPDKNPPSPLSRLLISAALVPGVWVRVWGWFNQYGPLGPNGRISDLDAFNPTHLDALVILRHPVFHTSMRQGWGLLLDILSWQNHKFSLLPLGWKGRTCTDVKCLFVGRKHRKVFPHNLQRILGGHECS